MLCEQINFVGTQDSRHDHTTGSEVQMITFETISDLSADREESLSRPPQPDFKTSQCYKSSSAPENEPFNLKVKVSKTPRGQSQESMCHKLSTPSLAKELTTDGGATSGYSRFGSQVYLCAGLNKT